MPEVRLAFVDLETTGLSPKLYSMFARHDLDSLMERHGLTAEVRHRALPDAQLIWQLPRLSHKQILRLPGHERTSDI